MLEVMADNTITKASKKLQTHIKYNYGNTKNKARYNSCSTQFLQQMSLNLSPHLHIHSLCPASGYSESRWPKWHLCLHTT